MIVILQLKTDVKVEVEAENLNMKIKTLKCHRSKWLLALCKRKQVGDLVHFKSQEWLRGW
jgi:hypothetical protein